MNENEKNPENTPTTEGESIVKTVIDTAEEEVEEVTEIAAASTPDSVKDMTEAATTTVPSVAEPVGEAVTPIEAIVGSVVTVSPLTKVKTFFSRFKYTILAFVLVVVALLAFTYMLEQKGKINTGVFEGVNKVVAMYKAVAKVNGVKITERDLNISVSQLKAGAEAQGTDVTDPKLQAQIQKQSLDMLVNTELLKQEAAARGVAITETDIDTRIESLKKDVGGEEVLKDRMKQFGVDEKVLRRDVKNELTIQALLDKEFEAKGIKISDEEVKAFYEQAGGAKAGLPKLEEVKDKIIEQLKSTKQQEVVTTLVDELRAKATIEELI